MTHDREHASLLSSDLARESPVRSRADGRDGSCQHRRPTMLPPADHRPWSLPSGPWIIAQQWHDLLFAHWPVRADAIRERLPRELALDTFDGEAWLGVVPFRMAGVRARGLPPIPGASAFPELNVRTYVTAQGKPGVWFFSLDAASRLAVEVARRTFHLPYLHADMRLEHDGEAVAYRSNRADRRAPPAEFVARYRPTGPARLSHPGSLEHWLTERYCLYARTPRGTVLRAEIHHVQWPLQPAEADLTANTMPAAAGLDLPARAPLLHFARRIDMIGWRPKSIA